MNNHVGYSAQILGRATCVLHDNEFNTCNLSSSAPAPTLESDLFWCDMTFCGEMCEASDESAAVRQTEMKMHSEHDKDLGVVETTQIFLCMQVQGYVLPRVVARRLLGASVGRI
jgi:hypothetical protein